MGGIVTTAAVDASTDTETQDAAESEDSTTETTETETTEQTSTGTDDETAKWKSLARKHENERRKLAKQIEELQAAQMSDQEKAIAEAAGKARSEVLVEVGQKLAAAELRAAGVPTEYIEDLNLARFVDDDGEVLGEQIAATAAKFASRKPSAPSVPTGPQNGSKPPQLTRDDLARMTPEQIVKAEEEGRLDQLLGSNP